jgi:ABC-type Fe3+-hydroxamate transport system substrate-binding protein
MQNSFTDQLGNHITINFPPKRIISLVPSQTELLFDLGLNDEVVGLTKFCIHPIDKFATRTKVGGTKKLNFEAIRALRPDLIIGNKEENTKAEIELLQQEFPVWMSDVNTLEQAQQMIIDLANVVDRAPEAAYLSHLIGAGFRDLQTLAAQKQIDTKVAYVIWKDPYMFAGQNTFINDVMTKLGLRNVISISRYPEVDFEALKLTNLQFLLLSSEPYPFSEKHVEELRKQLPDVEIMIVDGEMFSWYGSRLVKAVQYFFEFQNNFS